MNCWSTIDGLTIDSNEFLVIDTYFIQFIFTVLYKQPNIFLNLLLPHWLFQQSYIFGCNVLNFFECAYRWLYLPIWKYSKIIRSKNCWLGNYTTFLWTFKFNQKNFIFSYLSKLFLLRLKFLFHAISAQASKFWTLHFF